MKNMNLAAGLGLIAFAFGISAHAMTAIDCTIVRHASNQYWVLQSQDPALPDGYLIGSSEAVVDQMDALDVKKTYHCQIKMRRQPLYNAPALQTLMVYDLADCHD